jgi:DNA segregation ATPase FtsK/SpoIIIE-like protein
MTAQRPSDRPPRIQPALPVGTIEIPTPPDQRMATTSRLVQVALPLTTILGYILISAFGGSGRSPWLLIPMALSVVASTAFAFYTYRQEEVMRAAEREAYAQQLLDLYREMRAAHEAQRRFAQYNYPDPNGTVAIVRHAHAVANQPTKSSADVVRLWERRIGDSDFGLVRLGIATLPSTVVYTLRDVEGNSPLHRDALKLAADSQFVQTMPATLLLRPPADAEAQRDEHEPPLPPCCHALAIAGDQEPVHDLARTLIAQLATFHAPADLRLMVLAHRRDDWAWVSELPHAGAAEDGAAVLFTEEVGSNSNADPDQSPPLERWTEALRRLLVQRKLRLQDPDQQSTENPTLPQVVVVVDLLDAADDPQHPLHSIASTDAGLGILLAEGALLGAAVIFLVPRRSKVPSGCTALVEVQRQQDQTVLRYAEVGMNTLRLIGSADVLPAAQAVSLAQALAQLRLQQTEGSGLAKSVSFLELMRNDPNAAPTIAGLAQQAQQDWSLSLEQQRATWLRAKIGLMAGNKERTLVFSANRDGVHGLVAGSTGSGKSELLIALIAGMAATYSPQMLNFVLVDFKGGGAFEPFQKLPHVVDIVTNLNGDAVTRMFTSIRAELDRRQRLNTAHKVNTIVDYHKRGLHHTQPYPFLFIVIDEFAEMIAERAEAKVQLEQITRIGRSLGVHLLLAAQRPSGVTDQMRSNIKYRICLRVESQGESREMLRRTEAAYLPNNMPGRGYLQVGNEEIELIQVAYAGELYVPPDRQPRAPVRWKRNQQGVSSGDERPPRAVFLEVIDALHDLARQNGVPAQQAPWPGPLPTTLSLTEPLTEPRSPTSAPITAEVFLAHKDRLTLGHALDTTLCLNPALAHWIAEDTDWRQPLDWQQYALRPVIGLVDDPAKARQYPLSVELPHGHAVIYGGPGSGKTSCIRTIVTSLAATHAPNQVHIYVLDLGGRSLLPLNDLPHVGAVITPSDAEASYRERVEQLLRELDDLVEQRKQILGDARVDTLSAYNTQHPDRALPAVVLAIDNMTEFVETFGRVVEGGENGLERLVGLARQSRPYGVHLIITAGQPMQMPSQLVGFLTERFALRLADPTHYRDAVGSSAVDPIDLPGRGYAQIDQAALSVQFAQVDPRDVAELVKRQNEVLQRWPAARQARLPLTIDALPKAMLLRTMIARETGVDDAQLRAELADLMARQWEHSRRADRAEWLAVPLGVTSGNKIRTLRLQATLDGVHGMVAGGTGAGKSELLMSLIVSLALRYDPSVLNFVLVDYKGGGAFEPFRGLPHVVDLVTNLNKAAVRRMFTAIGAEMDRRSRVLNAVNAKDVVEYRTKGFHLRTDAAAPGPLPHLFIIIDEYAEMISTSPEFRDELDRITRIGRSLGVNLLLAAQRPVGVSDQMRANIKLRICLRVEGADTSREMLRRPDAALLPNGMPGRGYVQVGNEQIELIQVAYTGEPVPDEQVNERGEAPRFFEVVVRTAAAVLQRNGAALPRAPWPPALPDALTFDPADPQELSPAAQAQLARRISDGITLVPQLAAWLQQLASWPQLAWGHTSLQPVVGLLDDPHQARQLPLVINLQRGHVLLLGSSGTGKTSLLRMLALSLAATHGPEALHIHMLDLGGRSFQLLKELPHVGTVIVPDDGGYEEQVNLLWRELMTTLSERRARFGETGVDSLDAYNTRFPQAPLPAIVLMIDTIAEFIEAFSPRGSDSNEDNPLEQLIALARQGKNYGLHIIITANRLNMLSSKLYSLFSERLTLRLADTDEYVAIVGRAVDTIDEHPGRGATLVDRQPLLFQTALLPPGSAPDQGEKERIERIGQHMRAMIKREGRQYKPAMRLSALPKSVPYRDVLARYFSISPEETVFAEQLAHAVAASWHAQANSPAWLHVPLGVASGNLDRTLILAAQNDGVHGMVAGGTGSGKSELLMTFIIGLALIYPPSVLNFVLVDYKGGGAFKPFEQMPHCVEIVTNLNTSAVERMFSAISAEIRRRQQLNAETRTKDIVDYRKQGLQAQQPYPHLVIIIDEYAEMIESNPEYRLQLESITRVGRAQGVHLLLASQRPKGVSDQMRANIKLRLCLKVEDADTSRELLRRPDAARLPNGQPGRGFLQGGGDRIELMQVAYCGDAVTPPAQQRVQWHHRPPPQVSGEALKLFNYAVTITQAVHANAPVRRPWPAMLPTLFSLETPLPDWNKQEERGMYHLCPPVADWISGETAELWPGIDWATGAVQATLGLADDPEQARQEPLVIDLSRGHLAVFGDGGSGKTTLLRTIVTSLTATHRPDELHVYIIDLAGHNFRSMEAFPHIGAILAEDEALFDERLRRLLDYLERTATARQQQLARADVSSIAAYNQQNPDQLIPAILVVIDNIAVLQESYESLIEQNLIPLVRRALSVGISFVAAGNVPSNFTMRLYGLFAERLTFRQTNADRYMDIVGRGAVELDDQPGRGYMRINGRTQLIHAAQPVGIYADGRPVRTEQGDLRVIGARMHAAAAGFPEPSKPYPILTLSQEIALTELITLSSAYPARLPLGINGDLEPAWIDLRRAGPHFTLTGPPLSGKTTALRSWIISLAERYTPEQISLVLIDPQSRLFDYRGDLSLERLPQVVWTLSDMDQFDGFCNWLEAECAQLSTTEHAIFVLIDNFEEFSEELEADNKRAKRLAKIVRRHGRDGLHVVIAAGIENTNTDLRRKIQSSGYGLGLRTSTALSPLKVMRFPAGLEGRELPLGRGYLVKAGQTTLVQIATPHLLDPTGEEEQQIAAALDQWVAQIAARHPRRAISIPIPETPLDPAIVKLQILVQRTAQHLHGTGTPAGVAFASQIDELADDVWENREVLVNMLRTAWPLLEPNLPSFAETFEEVDLVFSIEDKLPPINESGT